MSIVALLAMMVSVIVPATAFASDDDATDTSGPITPAANDIEQLPTPPPDEPIDDPLEAAEPSGSGLAPPDFDDPIILDDTEPQPEDLEGGLEAAGEPADPADLAGETDGEGVDDTDLLDALGAEEPDGLEALEDDELEETSTPGGICAFDPTSEMKLDNNPRGTFDLGNPSSFTYEGTANPAWDGIVVTVLRRSVRVTGGSVTLCVKAGRGNAEVTLQDGQLVTTRTLGLTNRFGIGQTISHVVIRSGSPTQQPEIPWLPEKTWDFGAANGADNPTATITLTDPNNADNARTYVFTGEARNHSDPLMLPDGVLPDVSEPDYSAGEFVCAAEVTKLPPQPPCSVSTSCYTPPDGRVIVNNTCELPDPYLVIPAKQWEISGVASPTGYTEITITADGGSPSKTWRIGVDGEFITEDGFDDQPLEIPGHLGYIVSEQLFLGDGLECVVSILGDGDNGNNDEDNGNEGNGDPAVEALRGPPHRRPGSGRPGGHRHPCGGCQPAPVPTTVTLLNVCDIPEDEPNGTTTIRIPLPEIPEPEPEVEIEFTKTWLGVEDLDMAGVEVTFLVDGVEVALGETLSVDPGETLTLSESVDGLPSECPYTSNIPANYTVPVDVEDGDVFTIAVTNDVTCVLPTPILIAPPFDDPVVPPLEPEPEPEPEPLPEPEPEEPEVLPEIIEEPEAPEPTEEVAEVVLVATPLPRTGASTALLSLIAMLLLATGTTLLRRRRGSTR